MKKSKLPVLGLAAAKNKAQSRRFLGQSNYLTKISRALLSSGSERRVLCVLKVNNQ
jgi:hypothetical protein